MIQNLKSNIYISGKISGLKQQVYERKFKQAEIALYMIHDYANINVINPLDIKPLFGIKSWFFFMVTDIWALLKCDSVYFLSNWHDSRGARIEMLFALVLKKRLLFH